MTEYYLWLLQFMGAANPRSVKMLRHYGNAEEVYRAYQENERFLKILKPNEAEALKSASLDVSRDILKTCQAHNYRVITLEATDYPVALKHIYNPPILLFVSGTLPKEELSLTVIGTREACDYSYRVTKRICSGLARAGITIVSGMAVGIDKTAHTAAVEVKGRTVGVLACGFAVDYPKFSTPFRQEIVNAGGAVVTELMPYSRGERGYFNYRNRIMSGLSRGVLLIEAAEKSGCHITAAHAVNQNRDLFCVPPADIYNPRYRGVISYLRDGAIPVFDHSDVLNEYMITPVYENIENAENINNITVTSSIEVTPEKPQPNSKPFNIIEEQAPEPDLSVLSPKIIPIAELLKDGAKTIDYIGEKLELNADELSDLLLEMEIDGVIESVPGSSYMLRK
jgi:DNA processing protein